MSVCPWKQSAPTLALYATELKKVAILAIQDRGTFWESGEHVDQTFTQICLFLGYVAIYAVLRPFSG